MKINMRNVCSPLGYALCLSILISGPASRALENEVWISPNGLGTLNVAVTNASSSDVVYGNYVTYPSNVIGTPTFPFRCPTSGSLATVLTSVLTNQFMTIHFMAGTFSVPTNGITPLTGWKLRGAGIDNTVLQLVSGTPAQVFSLNVIGGTNGDPTENVEVSDMTIDCNMQNQTSVQGQLNAIGLWGSYTRISRVKAINWGTSSSAETFVMFINASAGHETATNCVIEDCIVTDPAPFSGSGGVSAISIGPNIRTGIMRNNLVYNIQSGGASQPTHLNALPGYNIVKDNYVFDVTGSGANGIYSDSWNPRDVLLQGNVMDNVSAGIFFNMQATNVTNIIMKDNVIRPAQSGSGIAYYTGEYTASNASVTNLIISGNIVYPTSNATDITAMSLNSYVTANVLNNVFDGGPSGYDVWIDYQTDPNWQQSIYPYPVELNNWSENVNLSGSQLRETTDIFWEPGEESSIMFTPTNTGWYRVIKGANELSSTIKIDSDFWNSTTSDIEFWFKVTSYTSTTNGMGEFSESLNGNVYGGTGQVTEARIGSDGTTGSGVYLDLYIPNVTGAHFVKVTSKGHFRSQLCNPPIYNPTTPNVYMTNGL